jgi:hypothetical protein
VVRERLDDYCSVFTAKIRGVLRACQLLENSNFSSIAIFSDFLIIRIPGHNGIPGNDNADLEAKQTLTQECGIESQLEYSDFRNALTRHQ